MTTARTIADLIEDPNNLTLGHLLGHVCRLVGQRRRTKLEQIGLRHAQGLILFRLWQQDGISQRVLARALHITAPTASNTLQRMERDGWIQRRRDESDQRIVRVHLTDKSRQLREEAKATFKELDNEMASMLTEEEHMSLKQALLKVHHYLTRDTAADNDPICSGRPETNDGQEKIQ